MYYKKFLLNLYLLLKQYYILKISEVKEDCRFFKGDIPCKPSKIYNVFCNNCNYYNKIKEKILIIKLGAAGDVIRTTPLLYPIHREYTNSFIFWLTNYPELVPLKKYNEEFKSVSVGVDSIIEFNLNNIIYLKEINFDILINLDKDNEAIALTKSINANKKFGFILKDRFCYPADKLSLHKYLTGIFDTLSKENKKSYQEEIFEICGFKFQNEKYILNIETDLSVDWNLDKSKIIIGLNTGCGNRWISRQWKEEYWIELIKLLKNENDIEIVLLGGSQEHERNLRISDKTKVKYFGNFELKKFINLVNHCDIIVTPVTMTLHIAIALNKYVILMNNIFNPNEFELYNNGVIIMPDKDCKCYYSPKCINKEYNCMDYLPPQKIYNAIKEYRKNRKK